MVTVCMMPPPLQNGTISSLQRERALHCWPSSWATCQHVVFLFTNEYTCPTLFGPFALRSAPHASFLLLRTPVGVKLHFPSSPAFRLWLSLSFLGGVVGKNPPASGGRYGFHPWVGKIPGGRRWQPTPAFSPEKFHEQRSLAGYSPWDPQRFGHNGTTERSSNPGWREARVQQSTSGSWDQSPHLGFLPLQGRQTESAACQPVCFTFPSLFLLLFHLILAILF